MGVPRAVQKQRDEAEAIQKRLAAQKGTQEEEVTQHNAGQNDLQQQPLVQQVPPPDEGSVDWEHRFKTMKAAHDTTVTGLRGENQELAARVGELEDLIRKAKPEPTAVQEVQFTDAEIEEYGEDLLDLVKRVAASMAVNPSDSQVTEELKALKDQFGDLVKHQVKSDEERFFEVLDQKVPDWEAVNEDQRFKDWLAQKMPMTNHERQVFLQQAQKSFDADTVAEYFNSWKGEVGLPTYYADTVGTSNTDVTVDSVAGQDTYIFTGAEIDQFYDDKRRGKYKGRENEGRQLEERIFQAQRENRVR